MCAKWRLDVLGIFFVFTNYTDWSCQYRYWKEKNHTFLWVLVQCQSYLRQVRFTQNEHFHIHCWMLRVHLTSRWMLNPQRLDSWKHENLSCIGGGDQLSARNWDQNWFFIRRWISTVGQNFEGTQQIRERLTKKTRNLVVTDEISANAGQLVVQESRFFGKTLKFKQANQQRRQNRSRLQNLSRHLLRNRFRFMKGIGLIWSL